MVSHPFTLATPSTACREVIEQVSEYFVPRIDAYGAELADQIHAEIDELTTDLYSETVLSCRANVALITNMIRQELDAASATAPPEAVAYARECARAGLPIESLMRAYRIGHAIYSRAWLERLPQLSASPEVIAEAVTFCSSWMFTYVDAVSVGITESFMHERERWVRSAAALRADEVRSILDGREADEARASQRLRYELGRTHVALLVWGEETEDPDATIGLYERVAHELGRALGGSDTLCVPLGRLTLAAWVGLRDARPDLTALPALQSSEVIAAGVRVAVGDAADSLEGFRRTHEEAQLARRVAQLRDRSPGSVIRYADAALTGLLTHDIVGAERFVARELGALADDTDASRRIASTLRVFLEEGSSFVRAARRLGVHENTVAYRVKRAGELLGHPVEERQLELRVALLLSGALRPRT